MELSSYGSNKRQPDGVDSSTWPVRKRTELLGMVAGVFILASSAVVLTTRQNRDASSAAAFRLYSDVSTYGASASSFPWNTYKITVPVTAGTGNTTVEFVNKYLAPYEGSNDLGCGGAKYWAAGLAQQLHFVDSVELDRGPSPLVTWTDMWESLNGDMTNFNVWMHNKVVLFVPDLSFHQTKLNDDQVAYMKRLSTLSDGTVMAHLSVSVQGRIYELVGPASSADTMGFSYWSGSDGECPAAHDLAFYTTYQGWADAYDYQVGLSSLGSVGDNGLPIPMVAYAMATSDAPEEQPDLLHLKDLTGAAFAHSTHSYSSTTTCETLDVTWDTTLNNMVPFRYVLNRAASSGEKNVKNYLNYIDDMHQRYTAKSLSEWGDNWDHWLDQHVGVQTTDGTLNKKVMDAMLSDAIPTGWRYGSGNSGGDDDATTSSYHYYAGYRSVFAWEWYVQDVTTHEKDVQPVQLCACVGENNAVAYEQETGLNACSQ